MGFGVTSDRNSVQTDFRGEKESVGWERNHSRNRITQGLGSSLPSLFDSVLAALSCSFSPLGGKTATSSSQQHQEKNRFFLLTEQTEGPFHNNPVMGDDEMGTEKLGNMPRFHN